MKILIIDDESLDLFVAKRLLSLEFEVEGFTTLEEALTWASTNSFDVALIDYYITPTVLAHDALKALRTLRGNTFKAFTLSNYVDSQQVSQLKEAGFDDVIFKPLTERLFVLLLEDKQEYVWGC